MKHFFKYVLAVVAFFQLHSFNVHAQTCDVLLADLLEYTKSSPYNVAEVTLAAVGVNNSGNVWGQHAVGQLKYYYKTSKPVKRYARAESEGLKGELLQYFSDRGGDMPNNSDLISLDRFWFDQKGADKLAVEMPINGATGNSCKNQVNLTLLTWGNTKSTACATCVGNVMYLMDNGMLLTFKKRQVPAPPK
jgi:hypothetical protein